MLLHPAVRLVSCPDACVVVHCSDLINPARKSLAGKQQTILADDTVCRADTAEGC